MQPYPEPYIWWEELIGEPYTDVNGNGIFDMGIDGFVRSMDPSINQDFNHNGRHDGPENMTRFQWEPGIPFDDIDGNGDMRFQGSWEYPLFTQGIPFLDLNANGEWDWQQRFASEMVRWKRIVTDSGDTIIQLVNVDSCFVYASDSGITYFALFRCGKMPWLVPKFIIDSTGVYMLHGRILAAIGDFSSGGRNDHLIPMTGVYLNDLNEQPMGEVEYYIRALGGQGIVTPDGNLTELTVVQIRDMRVPEYPQLLYAWDLYFDEALGLVAMHVIQERGIRERWYYLTRVYDSIPVPMAKSGTF